MKRLALALALLIAAAPPVLADAEANKRAVLEFYDKALNQKDFEAVAKYFGPHYIQHNPGAPDGIEGFKAFIGLRKEKFPNARSEIKRVFADGDGCGAECRRSGKPAGVRGCRGNDHGVRRGAGRQYRWRCPTLVVGHGAAVAGCV